MINYVNYCWIKFLWNNCRCSRSYQSKCIWSTLTTLTPNHFSGCFEVELLLGVTLFKIGDIWRTMQWRQEEAYPTGTELESNSWFKSLFEGLFLLLCVPPLISAWSIVKCYKARGWGVVDWLLGWELSCLGT